MFERRRPTIDDRSLNALSRMGNADQTGTSPNGFFDFVQTNLQWLVGGNFELIGKNCGVVLTLSNKYTVKNENDEWYFAKPVFICKN